MTQLPDWKLIDRYLAGDAAPDEQAAVQAWVDEQPNRQVAVAWLRAQRSGDEPAWNVDAAWRRQTSRRSERRATVPPLTRYMPTFWRIAAAAVLLVGLGAGWLATRQPSIVATSAAPMREVFTLNGQRTTVTLDDGTRVSLNGASRLRYAASYGSTGRDVYLDGQGYFEVKHDASRPFRVHVRNGMAEDLGTRFTVSAYADQPTIEVAVAEGVVALSRDSSASTGALRLEPGDVGRLDQSGVATKARVASLDRYLGWTSGTLVLDGLPLRRAAAEIERWYGVKIIIADSSLAARPVAARFQNETVQQALDAVALALGARVDRHESTYTFSIGRPMVRP